MSSRPAKRIRLDTNPGTVDRSKIPELVNSIDARTIANLLVTAAKAYPEIATLVQQEADRIAAAERDKVRKFDNLSVSVWETLNVTYDRLKDSHAFEMAGHAAASIEGCIEEIRAKCPKIANFKTKENALETLRKIGKSICLSHGIIGHEIRKDYTTRKALTSTMLEIASSLTYEERGWLRPWCYEKLVELRGIADAYSIFEGLNRVVDLWDGDEEGEDDSSNDGTEDVESQVGDDGT